MQATRYGILVLGALTFGCAGDPSALVEEKNQSHSRSEAHDFRRGGDGDWTKNRKRHRFCDRHRKQDGGLAKAKDLNPDPDVVEVNITARPSEHEIIPGVQTETCTFNGHFPGPLIEGKVGDTLIVHFKNELPSPSTIHWHGVELPAHMDGSNISQELVQPGGTFRYEFKLLNPATHWYHPHVDTDEQIERGLAAPLVIRDPEEERHLDVPPARDRTFVLDDILLELDEESDDYGQIAPFAHDDDFLEEGGTPAERAELIINGRDTEDNVLLVNGQGTVDPEAHPKKIPTVYVKQGVPERWRFINVSNGRFWRLSIPGRTLHQIGGDGGLFEEPAAIPPVEMIPSEHGADHSISNPDPDQGILLGVAERAEVLFVPEGEPGDVMYLEWHDFPKGLHRAIPTGEELPDGGICESGPCLTHAHDDGERPPKRIMKIVVTPGPKHGPDYEMPEQLRDIPDIRNDVDFDNLAQALPIAFGHANPTSEGLITLFATVEDRDALLQDIRARRGRGSTADVSRVAPPAYGPRPFPVVRDNPELALSSVVGETRYWEVINFTGGDHPFHAHGFFFQPVEVEFVDLENPENNRVEPWPRLELKDTIRVPQRPGGLATSWTIARGVVKISDEDRAPALQRAPDDLIAFGGDGGEGMSGGWLDHCHIDEHARGGMMTFLQVFPEP